MSTGRRQARWQKNHLGRRNPRSSWWEDGSAWILWYSSIAVPYEGKEAKYRWTVQLLCWDDTISEHQRAFDGCDDGSNLCSLHQGHNQQQATAADYWSNQAHWGMQCSYTSTIAREEEGSRIPNYQMFDRGIELRQSLMWFGSQC